MAHCDARRNRGYHGYGVNEPIYGGRRLPAIVVAHFAAAERYQASREQDFMYGDYTTRPDLHKQVWPRFLKGDEHDRSPRFTHHGSPRKRPCFVEGGEHDRSRQFTHHDSPQKNSRDNYSGAYAPHHDSPQKGHSSGVHAGRPRDSPRKNFRDGRGARFSSDDDDDSSDDEVDYDYDYNKGRKKTNAYPNQQPRKNPHQNGSQSYDASAHTKPTSDAYYDRFSHPAPDNYNNEPYPVLAPIKTRPDRGESVRSLAHIELGPSQHLMPHGIKTQQNEDALSCLGSAEAAEHNTHYKKNANRHRFLTGVMA